jgi:NAD(P)-dependent dehydrogenase (short-subunit alcohol dehydrogenase family)
MPAIPSTYAPSMAHRLDGRAAIVTGAAFGPKAALGSVFAQALGAAGAAVVVADLNDAEPVAEAIRAAGGRAHSVRADVTDEESTVAMVAAAVEKFGRLDILVNNAARGSNIPPVPIGALEVDEWDRVVAVGMKGTYLGAKAAAPAMAKNRYGKIVNLGSTTMQNGLPNRLHYVAAKGGILAMTRALARELGSQGIRVNTFATGMVMNPAVREAYKDKPDHLQKIRSARSIPEDITGADLIGPLVFLCSPESDAITGQFIVVDNGAWFS